MIKTDRPIADHWVSQVVGQQRRSLVPALVWALVVCLNTIIGHLGVGAREAAARGSVAMEQEVSLQMEEKAPFAAYVRGGGSLWGRR